MNPLNERAISAVLRVLQQRPYFATLSEQQLSPLAAQAIPRRFNAGESIFLEGDPSAGMWIIKTGNVKAYKLAADGHEHILHLLGPGDSFNDIPTLDGRPNAASAAAISDVVAWVIPTAAVDDALQRDHELSLAVIQGLALRVRQLVSQLEDLALRSVTGRLARFLLEQVADPALAGPAITRTLIAGHLATTPETISRALRTLEEIGAIEFDRHRIVIRRPDLLGEIAML
jgi:CRP/FNR family transcriptional regulator